MTKQKACRIAGISTIFAVSCLIQSCANSTVGPALIVSGTPVYDETSKSISRNAWSDSFACQATSSLQTNPLLENDSALEHSADPKDFDCTPPSDLDKSDVVGDEESSEASIVQPTADEKNNADASDNRRQDEGADEISTSPPDDATNVGPACISDNDCSDKGLGVATGTGFFISQMGFLVTNAHVIAESVELYVLHNDETLPAEVIISDEKNDLALLKVDMKSPSLALQNIEPLKGAKIAVIGFPNVVVMGNAVKATFGHVNANSGPRGDDRYLQFDAPIQPGNSGSPVVDASGAVVGIATASLNQAAALRTSGSLAQNVNYAVKSDFLLPLISIVPDWILAPEVPIQELSTTEVAAKVESSVVLIINLHDGSSEVQAERKKDVQQLKPTENADIYRRSPTDGRMEEESDIVTVEDGEQEGLVGEQAVHPADSGSQRVSTELQAGQADKKSATRPSGTGTWYLYKERSDNDKR